MTTLINPAPKGWQSQGWADGIHRGTDKGFYNADPEGGKDKPAISPFLNKSTSEALREALAINGACKVPTTYSSNEMFDLLQSGGAHHADGYRATADPLKIAYDNESFTSRTKGGGVVTATNAVLNLALCTTPASMTSWRDLQQAIGDGLLYRFSFYTGATKPERITMLDTTAIRKWYDTQRMLQQLPALSLRLEYDKKVQDKLDEKLTTASRASENGHQCAGWLNKMPARLARLAGIFQLLETGSDSRVVSSKNQRKAYEYLIHFAWEHQKYFYDALLMGGDIGSALKHLATRMYAKNLTRITKDELYGTKAQTSVRTWPEWRGQQLVIAAMEREWISPIQTKQLLMPGQEHKATTFEINPMFHDTFDKYEATLKAEWELVSRAMAGLRNRKDEWE